MSLQNMTKLVLIIQMYLYNISTLFNTKYNVITQHEYISTHIIYECIYENASILFST